MISQFKIFMEGNTSLKTGGHDVISSGSVIPFDSGELTELSFDYEDFKLRITLEFHDSDDEKDKNRRYYTPRWINGDPNTLELKFTNAAIAYGPGGPTHAIDLGTSRGNTLHLRIRIFGVDSDRIVIHYTLYSVAETSDDE